MHDGPVLLATDFSEDADEALRQAQRWAARRGRPLVLVHAVEDPTPMFSPMGDMQRFAAGLKQVKAKCEELLAAKADALAGEIATEVRVGSGAEVILRIADEREASLIVLGASGRGAIEKALIGTTAEQVLRHATTDVLLARHSPDAGPVVAASDLSEQSHPAIVVATSVEGQALHLLHALDIAHPVLAAFEPLLVMDDETRRELHGAALEVLKANLDRAGRDGTAEVREGRPDRVITNYAEEVGAALVVIATHGRTGLARLALGSVAGSVARDASCSVFVTRSKPTNPAGT